jgi:heme/copper-type cytochrome/quinol oxidase subunit 2
MDTAVTMNRTRLPLAMLGKLTVAALIYVGLYLVYLQLGPIGMLIPPLAIFAVVSLIFAAVVAVGWRWAPALGALWCVFLLIGNGDQLGYELTHPSAIGTFALTVSMCAALVVGTTAGISATIQNYRATERRTPALLPLALIALAALCVGAVLSAAATQPNATAGVSAEALSALPAFMAANNAFVQQEIRAHVGETVALRLENSDNEAHSFDIDELNIHAPMPVGQPALALFKPTQPGTYTFYCGIPAHRSFMVGKLIVE